MPPLIEAHALSKRFGKVRALDNLELSLPRGQAVAVLGPNGAGKTTFIRMVATLLVPDSGSLLVDGIDVVRHPREVRRMIGLAGQAAAVEEMMTGKENLMMVARLYGQSAKQAKSSAARVLSQVSLDEAADRLVRTYSGGMRRRLDLAASLVGSPRLLLLDEPTTGLDPAIRRELWELVRQIHAEGCTIILTTHYVEEAEVLCDQIGIINRGRMVAMGSPRDLVERFGGPRLEDVVVALGAGGAE